MRTSTTRVPLKSVDLSPLVATAQALLVPGQGLLAMDESMAICNRRLVHYGLAQTQTQTQMQMQMQMQTQTSRRGERELRARLAHDASLRTANRNAAAAQGQSVAAMAGEGTCA